MSSQNPSLYPRHRFPKLPVNEVKVQRVCDVIDTAELNRTEREAVRKHLRSLSGESSDKSRNPNHFSTVLVDDDARALREAVALSGKSRAAFLRELLREYLTHNPIKGAA